LTVYSQEVCSVDVFVKVTLAAITCDMQLSTVSHTGSVIVFF